MIYTAERFVRLHFYTHISSHKDNADDVLCHRLAYRTPFHHISRWDSAEAGQDSCKENCLELLNHNRGIAGIRYR